MGHSKVAAAGRSAMSAMSTGVRLRKASSAVLLEHPHPDLERASFDVDPLDHETTELSALLIGAMRVAGSVGLTAPQVGRNVRLLCVDVSGRPEARSCAGLVLLANPEILSMSGSALVRETCASVPGMLGVISRATEVVVSGVVPGTGRTVVVHADALEARALLHALDHLDGILFPDRIRDPAVDLVRRSSRRP